MVASLYDLELADEIITRLSSGEPLAEICRSPHMPSVTTVNRWCKAHPEFGERFLAARDEGFDQIAADCLRIADTPQLGETETSKEWGTEVKKGDMLDHRKLRVETRLKLLAKWDPRRYGDKQQVEHSGSMTLEQMVLASMTPRAKPEGVDDLV